MCVYRSGENISNWRFSSVFYFPFLAGWVCRAHVGGVGDVGCSGRCADVTIAPDGIGLLVDHLGRCTGDAYVQFTSAEMLARAKEKHLEKIGRR